ncbi:hypothetical protein PQE70_gp027 [Bacillus phage vB_BanS_Nate]|uniref:Uncharacterized protein n=1 Tax=Bacillus phage vB_BanS_Nate TaxID=2894788 RepID=A0AAE9CDL5_9CAUD|nr:hypothetical protein PQE70_gp027 [Bacillus phage vB_BanS_Nate]UGO50880.1 hypothetical protein NATE_27 [Bacillus phage vB_BanS_Nate]
MLMSEVLATLIVMGGMIGIGLLTGGLKIKFLNKKERAEGKGGLVINGKKIL